MKNTTLTLTLTTALAAYGASAHDGTDHVYEAQGASNLVIEGQEHGGPSIVYQRQGDGANIVYRGGDAANLVYQEQGGAANFVYQDRDGRKTVYQLAAADPTPQRDRAVTKLASRQR